jgi:hypothetical protein
VMGLGQSSPNEQHRACSMINKTVRTSKRRSLAH